MRSLMPMLILIQVAVIEAGVPGPSGIGTSRRGQTRRAAALRG